MSSMTRRFRPFAVIALCFTLVACAEGRQNETIGTIAGAGLGALVGSQFGGGSGQWIAGTIGALAGAWAGNQVGATMDANDRQYSQRTTQDALEYNRTGQTSTWRNPDSGNSGTVTPVRTYQSDAGNDCRTFESTVYVDGDQATGTGKACRDTDGTWKIAS